MILAWKIVYLLGFLKFQSEAVLGKWSDPKKDSLDQGIGNSAQNNCNSNSNSGQKIYWILQYAIFDPLKTTAIMQYLLICQITWWFNEINKYVYFYLNQISFKDIGILKVGN